MEPLNGVIEIKSDGTAECWAGAQFQTVEQMTVAAVLGVNTNTVLRALRELRDEGLLEFRRGRGITVTGTPQQSALIEQAKELLHYARTQGYKPDELIRIIQQLA